ncbi:MAG: hypothetical protein M3014_05915 [Chloroflexota bacterium]|nr:hypothetical protein [Chloroflexota bacterium]
MPISHPVAPPSEAARESISPAPSVSEIAHDGTSPSSLEQDALPAQQNSQDYQGAAPQIEPRVDVMPQLPTKPPVQAPQPREARQPQAEAHYQASYQPQVPVQPLQQPDAAAEPPQEQQLQPHEPLAAPSQVLTEAVQQPAQLRDIF